MSGIPDPTGPIDYDGPVSALADLSDGTRQMVPLPRPTTSPQEYGIVPGLMGAGVCNGCGSVVLMRDVHDQWHFHMERGMIGRTF